MLERSNKRVLVLFVLALAAFLSWWLSSTGPSLTPRVEKQRHDPDYYLVNFELTTMGDNGIPKHRLSATNMYHYPDDDTATLDSPHLIIYHDDEDSWDIRAEQGLVSEGGKSVMLQGDVFIKQLYASSDRNLEIMTRDVFIKPEEEFASTERAITIKDRYGVTEAVGMQADLKERQLQLMSQVRGSYEAYD
jgi:lipopolysaccharide export system protein LptC